VTGDELGALFTGAIRGMVLASETETRYREPLVAFADALDPRFGGLRDYVDPNHMLPQDLLPGARSVVSFFIPFAPEIPQANGQDRREVARDWVVAYVETNALIDRITARLIELLAEQGVRAAAEPATYNFDQTTLVSRWSHKSVAVVAGLGSFGLHHLVITDAGCAGRLGSLVLDAELPLGAVQSQERCLFFHDGSCLECVQACPAGALDQGNEIDKQACWDRCQQVAQLWSAVGRADVCGKCATGPCSVQSAVRAV
jgi:epoxyqueuosine reductase